MGLRVSLSGKMAFEQGLAKLKELPSCCDQEVFRWKRRPVRRLQEIVHLVEATGGEEVSKGEMGRRGHQTGDRTILCRAFSVTVETFVFILSEIRESLQGSSEMKDRFEQYEFTEIDLGLYPE